MNSRANEGFILVATLWMLAALAALASAYAVYAVETAPGAAVSDERLRAEAALRAGVELCAFRQLAWPKTERPDGGGFSTFVGSNRIDVAFKSENARINLNNAPHDLLAGLFEQVGATKAQGVYLADRIVAWRGKLEDDARRQETAIYVKAGLTYGPLGAPFDNTLEVSLLPGMSAALAQRALPFLTVYGKSSKVDPLVADPVVLAALPGATSAVVKSFLAARNGPAPDAATLTSMAGPVKDLVGLESNDHVRAEIVATLRNHRIRAEVVIKLNEKEATPYQILSWRDDFDGDGLIY